MNHSSGAASIAEIAFFEQAKREIFFQGFAKVVIQNGSQASHSGEGGAGAGLRPAPAPPSPRERQRREQSELATFAKL